jgi:hypothetical protein
MSDFRFSENLTFTKVVIVARKGLSLAFAQTTSGLRLTFLCVIVPANGISVTQSLLFCAFLLGMYGGDVTVLFNIYIYSIMKRYPGFCGLLPFLRI